MYQLSEKFLKSRLGLGDAPGAKIERDRPCDNCGYNLRGLTIGRNCPECGAPSGHPQAAGPADDLLASGDPHLRGRLILGLSLGAACLAVAVLARWGSLIAALVTGQISPAYSWGVAVNGLVWAAAVWIMTPRAIDHHWPRLMPVRWIVRITQCAWPVALPILAHARHGGVGPVVQEQLMAWQMTGRFIAGAGAVGVIGLMQVLASAAELPAASKRLSAAAWLVPVTSLLVWVYPSQFPWVFLLLLVILLVAWSWSMAWFALALWEMRTVAAWSLRAMHEAVERDRRIGDKRAAMEAATAAQVRATAREDIGDIPLE